MKTKSMHLKRNQLSKSLCKASGFTLLEMVIVLGIIAMIMGGAIYLMTGMQDSAKITQVESDQKTYMMALERYRTLAGQYPSDQQGLMALVDRPTTAPRPRKWSSMMDRLKEDPWGNPYIYKFPGSKKKNQPEIISWGEDGLEGTVDDLSSQQ
ncbi:MAG: type II secretion system major pseudopilin GspG [Akkermansiaceae bacterium]|jgi:general secretion pathway protein G|nr:type II secretion system major pseudopilin GspG [Akkermansiaceae bacterium]